MTQPLRGSERRRLLAGILGTEHLSTKAARERRAKLWLLIELLAVVLFGLMDRLRDTKLFILYGPDAANGKSTLTKVLLSLLPASAVTALDITRMGDPKFLLGLIGKKLHVVNELPQKPIPGAELKQLVTRDLMSAWRLYHGPVSFVPSHTTVIATNHAPRILGGVDPGVLRRLLIIEFDRQIPMKDRDPKIADKIIANESEALLYWAVLGAKRLLRNGRFTVPESSALALEQLRGSDSVAAFIEDCVRPNAGSHLKTAEIFAAYKRYVAAAGLPRGLAVQQFSIRFAQLTKTNPAIRPLRSNASRGYSGLEIDDAIITDMKAL